VNSEATCPHCGRTIPHQRPGWRDTARCRWMESIYDAGVAAGRAQSRCTECGHDLTADNDHSDGCSGRFRTGRQP